ncbi:GTP cyclohydrolase II [Streptomyces sp. B3I7]|uniref:GTP cyclohydrolase II n=1 Tax=Streptomyces sp. B3I7 TaxID=3042269 RepID=UPI002785525F|nr:GTP cyclohydrolase II [Streptomyces sp. B3I7]MDQ0812554.1 GTP cyclohydrolase II [Streptomyces sp. B3I7]
MRDLPAAPEPGDLADLTGPSDAVDAVVADTGAPGPLPEATVRTRVAVPLRFGDGYAVTADVVTFHGLVDGREHLALVLGDATTGPPLVRLHSECLTGDVFGSARCDCGPQLREAVERIAERGGVLLYLRQEGRGIGLYNKLDAYALQDDGLDTYAANAALGLPEDARDYTAAAQMLRALGIGTLDLLSNNPDKAEQLTALDLAVRDRVPTGVFTTAHNVRYLHAKAVQTRHTLPLAELRERPAG